MFKQHLYIVMPIKYYNTQLYSSFVLIALQHILACITLHCCACHASMVSQVLDCCTEEAFTLRIIRLCQDEHINSHVTISVLDCVTAIATAQ